MIEVRTQGMINIFENLAVEHAMMSFGKHSLENLSHFCFCNSQNALID